MPEETASTDNAEFRALTQQMYDTFVKKNHDYGNSCSKTFREFGMTSFLVRLSDKLNRLISLERTEALVKDESKIDTLMDMANYCVLAVIELKRSTPSN